MARRVPLSVGRKWSVGVSVAVGAEDARPVRGSVSAAADSFCTPRTEPCTQRRIGQARRSHATLIGRRLAAGRLKSGPRCRPMTVVLDSQRFALNDRPQAVHEGIANLKVPVKL